MRENCELTEEWAIPTVPGLEIDTANRIIQKILPYVRSHADIDDIRTSVAEAILNAMEHGNGMDGRKKVRVTLCIGNTALMIRTYDEGFGFQLEASTDKRERDIWHEEAEPRGWGLLFIRSFADRVETGWDAGQFFVEMQFAKEASK